MPSCHPCRRRRLPFRPHCPTAPCLTLVSPRPERRHVRTLDSTARQEAALTAATPPVRYGDRRSDAAGGRRLRDRRIAARSAAPCGHCAPSPAAPRTASAEARPPSQESSEAARPAANALRRPPADAGGRERRALSAFCSAAPTRTPSADTASASADEPPRCICATHRPNPPKSETGTGRQRPEHWSP